MSSPLDFEDPSVEEALIEEELARERETAEQAEALAAEPPPPPVELLETATLTPTKAALKDAWPPTGKSDYPVTRSGIL